MMRLRIIWAACLVPPLAMAGTPKELDCTGIKNTVSAATTPSTENLRQAVATYKVSPRAGKCLYPDVIVESVPVGEYEEYRPGGPRFVTLTGRTVYRWGGYEIQEASISSPDDMALKVIPNGSGYRLELIAKNRTGK
ncbi:MAG TPA: hypothetical protein ENI94_02515 [Gammaproteobacteria bacterium]|nr:hypothetical protein [Gammaproteobacteria bacterium]